MSGDLTGAQCCPSHTSVKLATSMLSIRQFSPRRMGYSYALGNYKKLLRWTFAIWLGLAMCTCVKAGKSDPPSLVPAQINWSTAARTDIEGIYVTLRDNHPGPVDATNPSFARWLTEGRERALEEAATAAHASDYWRIVRRYTNGFRDGHIGFEFSKPMTRSWPGLLTAHDMHGITRVVLNDEEPNVPIGAELKGCDAHGAEEMHQERVDPFWWNMDIPHERRWVSVHLMTAFEGDPTRPRVCRFLVDGVEFERTLSWTALSEERLDDLIRKSLQFGHTSIGLHRVGHGWFVSLPTFNLHGSDQLKSMRTLIRDLKKNVKTLRSAPWVVLDVRGNGGGNSEWGSKIASALFGRKIVDRIEGQFDWTVDWRASLLSAASLREAAAWSEKNQQMADSKYRRELASEIEKAVANSLVYVRRPAPARFGADAITVASPFKGQVFLLTDHVCASACLDFTDIARRLPGVLHIGLPTSADSIYIDNTEQLLPTGQGRLSWSLKVYRNRVRSNNQWYEPVIAWPGGAMTDEAVAAWVSGLKLKTNKNIDLNPMR